MDQKDKKNVIFELYLLDRFVSILPSKGIGKRKGGFRLHGNPPFLGQQFKL